METYRNCELVTHDSLQDYIDLENWVSALIISESEESVAADEVDWRQDFEVDDDSVFDPRESETGKDCLLGITTRGNIANWMYSGGNFVMWLHL